MLVLDFKEYKALPMADFSFSSSIDSVFADLESSAA